MTRPDPERISVTARLAAYYRAFSDVPFASDVARFIRAAETVDALVGEHGINASKLNEYAPMFEARYKSRFFINSTVIFPLLRDNPVIQYFQLEHERYRAV